MENSDGIKDVPQGVSGLNDDKKKMSEGSFCKKKYFQIINFEIENSLNSSVSPVRQARQGRNLLSQFFYLIFY